MKNYLLNQKFAAVTLIELTIVFVISAIVTITSFNVITRYYNTSQVVTETDSVISYLRFSRQEAIGNSTGDEYSVKFFNDRYVGFFGTSYTEGAGGNDENDIRNDVTLSTNFTNDLLTFDNFTGRPTETGTITITSNVSGVTNEITINTLGVIDD